MNNEKLKTGIEVIDKELSKGSSLEEFVKFYLDTELQPYQKKMLDFIENNQNISREEFAERYSLNTRGRNKRINILSTPLNNDSSCYAYHSLKAQPENIEKKKEFTFIILDDPIKEKGLI